MSASGVSSAISRYRTLRESAVMSLETCIGREHNVFHETASHAHRVQLPWPVLNYVKYQTLLGLDQRYYRNKWFDEAGLDPIRDFMLGQTRESDLILFAEIAGVDNLETPEDVPFSLLVPAFMTSELKTAFEISGL